MDLTAHNPVSTTDVLSTMTRHTESVNSDIKSTETTLSANIETSKIDIITNIEVTEIALNDSIHDSTTEVLSTIKINSESVNSEIKSTEANLAANIKISKIDIMKNVEGTEMALKDCFNDGTTEVLSTIQINTESVNSEIKSTEANLAENIEKSKIDIITNVECTKMALKDFIRDSSIDVLSTITKQTESVNSEMKSTMKDTASTIMSAFESLREDFNALTKNVPISDENVTKCQSTSTYIAGGHETDMEFETTDAEPDNDVCESPVSTGNSSQTIKTDDTPSTGRIKRKRSSSLYEINSGDQNTQPKRLKSDEKSDHNTDSNEDNEYASDNGGSDIEDDDLPVKHKRIYEPRDYQRELAEKALLGQNTIICAETGTGKTWVALYIIDKHLSETSKDTRKVAFMARTGALIKQQYNLFRKCLPDFKTKLLTSDDEESRNVNVFISMQDIICFTPQILVNALDRGNVPSLSKFSLLVFDECHHTRGDEPYATLARKYLIEKANGQKELPQIVGLTASIGVGRSTTVEEAVDYMLHVCASLDVIPPISTVVRCRESFEKWVITPKEEKFKMIVMNPDPCKDILLTAIEDAESLLEDVMFLQPDMIDLLLEKRPAERDSQAYNNWTVDLEKRAQLSIVNDPHISRDISACAVYLNVYNSAIEVSNLLQIADVARYLAERHTREMDGQHKHSETEKKLFEKLKEVQKKLIKLRNDKDAANRNVQIVSELLQKMILEQADESRAIVFVKARATCRALARFLETDLKKIGVGVSPFYGHQTKLADEGMTEIEQTEILKKFRDGYYKVMVSTSVGTEGIDVPHCNIVINYNYSGNEITKIQLKGRSRKKGATIIVIGGDKQLELEEINAYKANMMYKAIEDLNKSDPRIAGRKVKDFQAEEMQKHRMKIETEKAKKSRRSEVDLAIMCRHCSTFACLVSNVRKIGAHHFVIDKDFPSKVTTKPHKDPIKYDDFKKKLKMYCKKCPSDWGIVSERDGADYYTLKLMYFKMKNTQTGDITSYKQWLDVPYKVPELGSEDIPQLFRKETDASASDQ